MKLTLNKVIVVGSILVALTMSWFIAQAYEDHKVELVDVSEQQENREQELLEELAGVKVELETTQSSVKALCTEFVKPGPEVREECSEHVEVVPLCPVEPQEDGTTGIEGDCTEATL